MIRQRRERALLPLAPSAVSGRFALEGLSEIIVGYDMYIAVKS